MAVGTGLAGELALAGSKCHFVQEQQDWGNNPVSVLVALLVGVDCMGGSGGLVGAVAGMVGIAGVVGTRGTCDIYRGPWNVPYHTATAISCN